MNQNNVTIREHKKVWMWDGPAGANGQEVGFLAQRRPCMESFWATLKRELVYPQKRFATRYEACQAIFEYIHIFYNREWLHSPLGYETLEVFEG